MAKRKKGRRKYTVIYTGPKSSAMKKKRTKVILSIFIPLATLSSGAGLKMIANPTLGYILVGVGAVLGWSSLVISGLINFQVWHKILGYAIIIIMTLIFAFAIPNSEPDIPKDDQETESVPQSITTTIHDSPNSVAQSAGGNIIDSPVTINQGINREELEETLRKYLPENVEDQIREEYSLGYVLFAHLAEPKMVLPYKVVQNVSIEGDWDNIKIYQNEYSDPDEVWIEIPNFRLKYKYISMANIVPSVKLVPGYKMAILYDKVDSLVVEVQCLQSNPIGYSFVLGFKKMEQEHI